MPPAVTVIIPVYNAAPYLRECLDSVAKQTLRELEILCIDDGSTDTSPNLLQEYLSQDGRIRVLHQENSGPGPTRNRGMAEARGQYIFFLDADDYLPGPEVLERLYGCAEQTHLSVVGGCLEMDVDGRRQPHPEAEMRFDHEGAVNYRDWQYDYGYYRFLYETNFLRDNSLTFPIRLRYEDPRFFVEALTLAETLYAIPDCTYVWREHVISWTVKKMTDVLDSMADLVHYAKKEHLEKVQRRQFLRLVTEYKEPLCHMLCSEARFSVLGHLLDCYACFDQRTLGSVVHRVPFLQIFGITKTDMLVLFKRNYLHCTVIQE